VGHPPVLDEDGVLPLAKQSYAMWRYYGDIDEPWRRGDIQVGGLVGAGRSSPFPRPAGKRENRFGLNEAGTMTIATMSQRHERRRIRKRGRGACAPPLPDAGRQVNQLLFNEERGILRLGRIWDSMYAVPPWSRSRVVPALFRYPAGRG
jgi:hypothetical protein